MCVYRFGLLVREGETYGVRANDQRKQTDSGVKMVAMTLLSIVAFVALICVVLLLLYYFYYPMGKDCSLHTLMYCRCGLNN